MVLRTFGRLLRPGGWSGRRRVALLAALLVASVLASTAAGAAVVSGDGIDALGGQASDGTPLSSCTTIDQPGRYVLTSDLGASSGPCLHVNASDVVLDGNGHSVEGTAADAGPGILVFNGTATHDPDPSRSSDVATDRTGAPLSNVTVRDVETTGWSVGVQLGESVARGPSETAVRSVTADENGYGIAGYGVDGLDLAGVAATNNAESGVEFWEVERVTADGVTASHNGGHGLQLWDSVRHSTFTDVAATHNDLTGISFGITSDNNTVARSRVADNGRAGIAFRDSGDNVIRNATIVENDGPGVLSEPSGGDRVVDSTVARNAISYRKRFGGGPYGVVGGDVVLDSGTNVSFDQSVRALDERASAPSTPADATVVGPVANLTVESGETGDARFEVPYDASAVGSDEDVALWLYDGSGWTELSSTVDAGEGTATATATRTGVLVPLATPGDGDGGSGDGQSGDGATEVASCTTIEEPGRYEVASDLAASSGPCIHVAASDVVVDGNGHEVAATASDPGVGVLVFNGTASQSDLSRPPLRNVTLVNVETAGWSTGVQIGGSLDADGPTATLRNVHVTDGGDGLQAFGADRLCLHEIRAANNSGDGLSLWETRNLSATHVNATGNGEYGFDLWDNVHDSAFEDVAAVGNDGGGIDVGRVTANNEIADARVADNGGPGIRFADSFDNTVRNATVVDNDGPGLFSDPASEDRVVDSTVAGNAITYRQRFADDENYGIIAEDVVLGNGTVTSFGLPVSALDERDAAPTPPADATVVGPVANLTVHDDVTADAEFAVPYDASAVGSDEDVALWLYDGSDWTELSSTVDASEDAVTATATRTGVVAPLATSNGDSGSGDGSDGDGDESDGDEGDGDQSDGDEGDGDEGDGDQSDGDEGDGDGGAGVGDGDDDESEGTGVVGDESAFVIDSTGNGEEFAYGFVVDGTVEKGHASGVSADSEEHVEVRDDGRTVALGSTGDRVGDAFVVTGEIDSFDSFPDDADVRLELDGEDVTDELLDDDA